MFDPTTYNSDFLEKKNWGWKYNIYTDHFIGIDFCFAKKGGESSWHFHDHQYNMFLVTAGRLRITREAAPESDKRITFVIGDGCKDRVTRIHPAHTHKFEVLEDVSFIEVMYVRLDRNDITRITDALYNYPS